MSAVLPTPELAAIEAALADLTSAMETGSVKPELAAIEGALADLTAAMETAGIAKAIDAATKAIARLRPEITVNVPQQAAPEVTVQVNPTPVNVAVEAVMPTQPAPIIHVMPATDQTGATWEVRLPGIYGGSDRVMTIKRTA